MSPTPDSVDGIDCNSSRHQHVIQIHFPSLPHSQAHTCDHINHDNRPRKNRAEEVICTDCTITKESTVPHHESHIDDLEKERRTIMRPEPAAATIPELQGTMRSSQSHEEPQSNTFSRVIKRYRIFIHLLLWIAFTGWWIAGLILHGINDPLSSNTGWLKPFLLWIAITMRFLSLQVPISIFTKPIIWAWEEISVHFAQLLPDRYKTPLAALVVVSVFLIGGFASPESEDNTRDNRAVSLFGLAVFIAILYATSRNRKAVNWHTVIMGMLVGTA